MIKCRIVSFSIIIQHGDIWLCFKTVLTHAQLYFTHISIFRFIQNVKVLCALFNIQLCVHMSEDSGGLLFLDPLYSSEIDVIWLH